MFDIFEYTDDDFDAIDILLEKHNIPILNTETNEIVLEWVDRLTFNPEDFEVFLDELKSRRLRLPKSQLKFILDITDIENKINLANLNKFKEFMF